MPTVCFYFQVHQPYRLRRYSVFDSRPAYFDDNLNAQLISKVARRCYEPMNELLLDQLHRHEGHFTFAMSLTGSVIEQMRDHAPRALESFIRLIETGHVELLSETYFHSLASVFSRKEFEEQIKLHSTLIHNLFGQTPKILRNTELIYDNGVSLAAGKLGFKGVLAEGTPALIGDRKIGHIYEGRSRVKLLLRHFGLSDDIAFRFSDKSWPAWPLHADTFAGMITRSNEEHANLFMDYETFGEHQPADTGIFDFMRALPGEILKANNIFARPSDLLTIKPAGKIDCPTPVSWADTERDLSAWLGNAMQQTSMEALWKLEKPIKKLGDDTLLRDWRRITASDHPYYMSTKYLTDQAVHQHFSPYESPYDAYINFNNVVDHLKTRVKG